MKTHFIRFKRKKEPVQIWKCTEDQFNKTMIAIAKFAQIIDLREDLGQIFTFKDFDGSGIFPKIKIEKQLPEPKISKEERIQRKKTREKLEDEAVKRGEQWAIEIVTRRNNPNISKAEEALEQEKRNETVARKYVEEGVEGAKFDNGKK